MVFSVLFMQILELSAQNASRYGGTWPCMGHFFLFLKGLDFVHSAGMILTPNFSDLAYRYAFFLLYSLFFKNPLPCNISTRNKRNDSCTGRAESNQSVCDRYPVVAHSFTSTPPCARHRHGDLSATDRPKEHSSCTVPRKSWDRSS